MAHTFPWEFFPETARTADTNPSDEQYLRGNEQLRRAAQHADQTPRTDWLDLLVPR